MIKRVAGFLAIALFVLYGGTAFFVRSAHAAPGDWQKGVSILPRWNTDFSSDTFKQSIQNAIKDNINYVTLILPYYQSNVGSTDVGAGWNTPTDQSLADGIDYLHSQGLHVALKIHDYPNDGQWSAYINPGDRATWFANYNTILQHVGTIAQAHGVEEIVIADELLDMSEDDVNPTNTQNWVNMIKNLRSIYSGKLTYSANWGVPGWTDEKNHISFWSQLDYVGISAYYNLSDDLQGSWSNYNSTDIAPLQQRTGKPILFTEVGYRSVSGDHTQPWNWWFSGNTDMQEQVNDYQAMFSFWSNYSYMAGFQLWNWSSDPNAGGTGNQDYTPQNKPAEQTMAQWFGNTTGGSGGGTGGGTGGSGGGSTGGSGGGTSGGSASSFSTTATASSTATQGQPLTINTSVTANGGNMTNVIVDTEIYDQSGARVFQKFFENQNFTVGTANSYSDSWIPSQTGNFTFKVGVFNSTWSQSFYWNDNALTIAVQSSSGGSGSGGGGTGGGTGGSGGGSTGGSGGTAQPGAIDVWWPTNNATVSGLQPFKAMLTNSDVSTYNMFWQVDGGQLNQMYNSNTDYPHKEAMVDLSGWNWNSNNQYKINFVAQSPSGSALGQQQETINVAH